MEIWRIINTGMKAEDCVINPKRMNWLRVSADVGRIYVARSYYQAVSPHHCLLRIFQMWAWHLCPGRLGWEQQSRNLNWLWGQVECLWHRFLLEQWNFQDQLQTQALSDWNWPSLFHKPADRLPRDHCRVRQECGDGEARMSPPKYASST